MINKLKYLLKKALNISPYRKYCYSQFAEDLIVQSIFKNIIKIDKPTYIDIGSHHPEYINNTALLYKKGSRGINIEPDTTLISEFYKTRKADKNLNIAVSNLNGEATLFIMEQRTLNTLSEKEALRCENEEGIKILERIIIPVLTFEAIIDKYNNGICPDFMSLDVEGFEMDILETINFEKNSPKVISIETISYSTNGKSIKNNFLINYIKNKGYYVFADTMLNTIFVRTDLLNILYSDNN